MGLQFGHARIDENGNIQGGKAGDNNGKEVCVTPMYKEKWSALLRPRSKTLAKKLAKTMLDACYNAYIGYHQGKRLTLDNQAKKHGYDLTKINTPCDTDCSALVGVCLNANKVKVSPAITTRNMVEVIRNTKKFDLYRTIPSILKEGDILVREGVHTVIVVDSTLILRKESDVMSKFKTTTSLNQRYGAGTDYPIIQTVPKGKSVNWYGYSFIVGDTEWKLVEYNGKLGFCSSKYLKG